MAKDPAFLFYTSDFLTGTMLMTDEQVGKYMRLLCLQHQQGHLNEEDMLSICKTYDIKIFKKFVKDSNGLYYNVRLEEESDKRSKYTESRRENGLHNKKKNTNKHMPIHMEDVNEDINRDVITNEDKTEVNTKKCVFKKPTKTEIIDYINEKQLKVDSETFIDHYESNGWKVGKVPMKDWKATLRNWDRKTKEVKKPFKNEFLEKLNEERTNL